nr:hypothetical protein CH569_00380 [Haemophilus influenzae]RFO72508.1 hypothetical protein CH568_00380 [Haemophilus influenzae]
MHRFSKCVLKYTPLNFKNQRLLPQIFMRVKGRSIRLIGLHVNLPEENKQEQMSLW